MRRPIFLVCVGFYCGTAGAQPETQFVSTVYPILQASNCRSCHVTNGLAGTTRLRFPPADATVSRIEEFGRGLAPLIDRVAPERSLLIRKPTNREKHTGGELIRPGGSEERELVAWIRAAAAESSGKPFISDSKTTFERAAHAQLRRLTHSQYNNTVRDLLADDSRPADRFPPEDYVNGFRNQTAAQGISPLLAEAYNTAAERLARAAFQGGTDEAKLIPCVPESFADAGCRASFVRSFGLRAFRRPLSSDEQTRYEQVFVSAAEPNRSFLAGAQLVVEAMLQSPKFLFHSGESLAESRAWTIASRLSFFLWDTMPDARLFEDAASGKLLTQGGMKAAIQRMLKDDRARQAVDQFASQWLRFDLALGAVRDRALYPQFTPELAAAMVEELRLLIADVVWNDRNFLELFTARDTFISSDLAALYGVPAPPSEFARMELPVDSGRGGVVGRALFLASTSKPGETSPTVRGFFVRERFLCQQVPDPPPGTSANLPPLTESKPQTTRERLGEHTINPSCRGCHQLMDPIGFGLEGFDAIGRRREKQRIVFMPDRTERGKKPVTVNLPLDLRGEVQGIAKSEFSSPAELGNLLAQSEQCQQCIVKQLFRYAFGRLETDTDRAVVDHANSVFRTSGFRLTTLMAYLSEVLAGSEGMN